MPVSNLADARRQYYGGNSTGNAPQELGNRFYQGNGTRTGERIDGRVRRKTMMGGGAQGSISSRGTRSEVMEQEADAARERERRRGVAQARQEQAETAASMQPRAAASTKAKGHWKEGRSAGSHIWIEDKDEPAKPAPTVASEPIGPKQETGNKTQPATGLAAARRRRAADKPRLIDGKDARRYDKKQRETAQGWVPETTRKADNQDLDKPGWSRRLDSWG